MWLVCFHAHTRQSANTHGSLSFLCLSSFGFACNLIAATDIRKQNRVVHRTDLHTTFLLFSCELEIFIKMILHSIANAQTVCVYLIGANYISMKADDDDDDDDNCRAIFVNCLVGSFFAHSRSLPVSSLHFIKIMTILFWQTIRKISAIAFQLLLLIFFPLMLMVVVVFAASWIESLAHNFKIQIELNWMLIHWAFSIKKLRRLGFFLIAHIVLWSLFIWIIVCDWVCVTTTDANRCKILDCWSNIEIPSRCFVNRSFFHFKDNRTPWKKVRRIFVFANH